MAVIIWWVVLIYAWHQKKNDFKFLFFLMFLQGCFTGFVQVNDFFSLFVLIEIITIISAILILYKKDGISVKAGLYYLLFNSFGMMIYLIGLALLYVKVGTLNISEIGIIISNSDSMYDNYSIIQVSFACFFVAMCVKAALFPVYDWLPRAHTAAPAYISALLSGLLVKTGVYGLLRVLETFDYHDIYSFMFYLGFFTAISGIIFAVSQKDIKAILAFHTISQIGLIIMSLSAATTVGLIGGYLHIFNHFLFKSLLFLGAGIIINEYGVRRVTEIKGIGRAHPFLTLCMVIAILSITGAPFFIGFISKSMMKLSMTGSMQTYMMQLVSLGTIISFLKFSKIFFGEPGYTKRINRGQVFGVAILAVLCVVTYFVELDLIKGFLSINGLAMQDQMNSHVKYVVKLTTDSRQMLLYIGMVMLGYILYRVVIRPKAKIWHYVRHFRMRFQNAIISILLFLVLVLNLL